MNVYLSIELMVAACVAVLAIGIYMTAVENNILNKRK